jgi:hypothetical protein
MEFILYICTAGWLMCGDVREFTYPNEASCYRALEEIYKRQSPSDFKYIICKPKYEVKK